MLVFTFGPPDKHHIDNFSETFFRAFVILKTSRISVSKSQGELGNQHPKTTL